MQATYKDNIITISEETVTIENHTEKIQISLTQLCRAVYYSSPYQMNFNEIDLDILRYIYHTMLPDYYEKYPQFINGRTYESLNTDRNIYRNVKAGNTQMQNQTITWLF